MPATWHTPKTWALNELVTETLLNEQLRDNLTYLLTRPSTSLNLPALGTVATTSTTLVAVPGCSVNLTLTSTRALIILSGFFTCYPTENIGRYMFLDLAIDGTRVGGANGLQQIAGTSVIDKGKNGNSESEPGFVNWTTLLTGLTPGTRTIQLYWRVNANATIQLLGGFGGHLTAIEV